MKNKKKLFVLLIIAAFCVYSIILYIAFGSIRTDREREFSILLSNRIHSSVERVMNTPLYVAKSMASDVFVRDFMKNEISLDDSEASKIAGDYLSTLRDGTDSYETFIVSERSLRYFTCNGLYKVIDPVNDYYDIWYNEFKEKDIPYEIKSDEDEAQGGILTVFVNVKTYDENGNFLGVCGVGATLDELQEILREFEEEYNIKVTLVDSDGLVQVDTQTINIENVYKSSRLLSDKEDYVYTSKGNNGYIVTQYVDSLGWYLVVQSNVDSSGSGKIYPLFIVLEVLGGAIAAAGAWFVIRKMGDLSAFAGKENEIDPLTGLYNRNYFKSVYGERGYFNTVRYKSIAVFDIDFFKEANDTIDGNDVLKDVAERVREVFGEKGEIFRWGGDEFVILMEWSIEFGYGLCKELCRKVEEEGKVTLSIGVTEVRLSDTIKKNYYRAAQYCFLVKEMGGNGVKRG